MQRLQTSGRNDCSDTPGLRIIRHDSELASWTSIFREPDPRLKGLVEGPYQGWIERTNGSFLRREVPSTIVPVIINLGPPFRMVNSTASGSAPRIHNSFVAGMHESFALVESGGLSICVQVNFRPLGAFRFLGVPMRTLSNQVFELDDVLGPTARRLISQMQDASTWAARFEILDSFILARVDHAAPSSPDLRWAWRKLNESGGLIDIGTLASELCCSRKHLITRFRHEIGLPPKTLARIIRFGRVTETLKENEVKNWVEIANACGYYDQAHLIRDFREFAGSTPTEYLGRILPDGGGLSGESGFVRAGSQRQTAR
jgi:AraC-like DNA-binding protein